MDLLTLSSSLRNPLRKLAVTNPAAEDENFCHRTLSCNSSSCHAPLQREGPWPQDFAGRFAVRALANRDRDVEGPNARAGGTTLHRVRARGRKATGKRSI